MTNRLAKPEKVLVLGATGGIGGEMARQLRDAGWDVRALQRSLMDEQESREGILWLRGDAMNRDDVAHAAQGCSVIVHAVNPPGYRRWADLVVPMLDNTIAAAIAESATIVFPGTVYNYGADALPVLTENLPQNPVTRKGRIRVEMERRLRDSVTRGARVLIVRAGDYFGPRPGNGWFNQALIKPGQPVRTISYPGTAGVGHQWAYLPDVARTMIALLARRETLAPFEMFHMAGHWDTDGRQMVNAIGRVVTRRGGTTPTTQSLPWWLLRLVSPFNVTLREMMEMRYLWKMPVELVNGRLIAVLGHEPHTDWDTAVEAALAGAGCLDDGLQQTVAS